MRRWTVLLAGVAAVAAVAGHLLFGPIPARTSGPRPLAPVTARTTTDGATPGDPQHPGAGPDAHPHATDEDWPDAPADAPTWWLPPAPAAGPADLAAIDLAERAVTAFARPAPGTDLQWWPGVHPFLSAQAALDYADVDPQQVGYTAVTGGGHLVAVPSHLPIAGVDVPTDAGVYRVLLEPDERKPSGWAVIALRPAEADA